MRQLCVSLSKLGWLACGGPVGQIGLMHFEAAGMRCSQRFDAGRRPRELPSPVGLMAAIPRSCGKTWRTVKVANAHILVV
jgi:hypothetical protein